MFTITCLSAHRPTPDQVKKSMTSMTPQNHIIIIFIFNGQPKPHTSAIISMIILQLQMVCTINNSV